MTLKELADEYQQKKRNIRRMEQELEMLRDGIVPATQRLTGMPGGHGEHGDPTSAIVVRIESLAEETDKAKAELEPVFAKLCSAISTLSEKESDATILFHRLVRREPYPCIAATVYYSDAHCRNIVSKYLSSDVMTV